MEFHIEKGTYGIVPCGTTGESATLSHREHDDVIKAVVKAVTHYNSPEIIAEVSKGLGDAMPGLDIRSLKEEELLAVRGW